jgi:hypothetical protein
MLLRIAVFVLGTASALWFLYANSKSTEDASEDSNFKPHFLRISKSILTGVFWHLKV